MNQKKLGIRSWPYGVASLTLCVFLGAALWRVFERTGCLEALPWDPASHALDGLRLYNNILTFSPISFWLNLSQMVHWPPLPPLLSVPFYFLFGPRVEAPVALSLACFLGLILLASFFFDRFLTKSSKWIALTVFCALLVSAPMLLRFSFLVMYEIPGALFTLMAVLFLGLGLHKAAALSGLALLLTKWNYGLQFLLFYFIVEWLESTRAQRETLLKKFVLPYISPSNNRITFLMAIPFFALASFIIVTGGWSGEIFGQRISITRLDNPLYGLFVILAIRFFRALHSQRGELQNLSPGTRKGILYAVVPFAVWLLYPHPNRIKGLLYHLNYGAKAPPNRLSWEVFSYYPNQWIEHFSISPLQALLVLVCVVLALWVARRQKLPRTVAAYVLFLWLSSTYLTTNHEARFLLHAVPCAFFVTAWLVGDLTRKHWAFGILALLFIAIPVSRRDRLQDFFQAKTHPQSGWENAGGWCYGDRNMVETIRKQIIERSDASLNLVTVGISDMTPMCPLVIWEMNRSNPNYSTWPLPKTCDYGYRVTAETYVSQRLTEQKLDWLLVLSGESSEAASQVSQLIRPNWQAFPVQLDPKGYRGTLYQIPPNS